MVCRAVEGSAASRLSRRRSAEAAVANVGSAHFCSYSTDMVRATALHNQIVEKQILRLKILHLNKFTLTAWRCRNSLSEFRNNIIKRSNIIIKQTMIALLLHEMSNVATCHFSHLIPWYGMLTY